MSPSKPGHENPEIPEGLQPAGAPRRLEAADTDVSFDGEPLGPFETTEELRPLDRIIGQERAMAAFEIGLGIGQEGYNIYVSGLTGSGKMETIRRNLEKRLKGSPVPDDWVYVHNFDRPDEPCAIRLTPGEGRKLRREMSRLIERFREELPKAFRQEDFRHEKDRLTEKYRGKFERQVEGLGEKAKEVGFEMRESQEGNIMFLPLIEGKIPESKEQFDALPDEEKKRLEDLQKQLSKEAGRIMRSQKDIFGELSEEVREAERRFASTIVSPLIERIKTKFPDNERVAVWLGNVESHVLENLSDFRESGKGVKAGPLPGLVVAQDSDPSFLEYQVNVVVDHSASDRAPVIIEEYPTYKNLFGTIDRVPDPSGRLTTNFTEITAGSILRANGGYLVFNLEDALTEPLVYKNLKRVLKTGNLRFEMYDPISIISSVALRPETIPISTKVVVVGAPWLYLQLSFYDDDFRGMFKIKAEFGTEMKRGSKEQQDYARFVTTLAREEGLRPFDRDAVIEVIRFGARRAARQDRLLTRFSEVADILREAEFFAKRQDAETVGAPHVREALESRVYRSDRIAEKIRELIAEGTLLIDIEGRRAGQVNGLAVVSLGDYAFGRPSRVTATIGLGSEGVINIEREAKLSGSTHDKGILILGGYLRHVYGQDKPLALTASLCFEQTYTGVDGDSASSTELYALLSRLADVPLRQDVAVTGSINQWGEVQAIGGANEKVEGFFDVCRESGLTGSQGVCIPASNVRNLVLREDVREAIAKGRFHIWPVASIDEGLELLGGVRAGSPAEEGTFHGRVDRKLRKMAEDIRAFGSQPVAPSVLTEKQEVPPHVPPKLPDETP